MALTSSEELLLGWAALEGSSNQEGWRSIPLSAVGEIKLQAARVFPSNDLALLVEFSGISSINPRNLPQSQGFRIVLTSLDGGISNKWIALIHQNGKMGDLFRLMSCDIVTMLSKNFDSSQNELLQLFIQRIEAWQNFMSRESTQLSPEAELGLVGELEFLETLLASNISNEKAIEAWIGPKERAKDFSFGSLAVEVKSSSSKVGFPITIHSLEQLEETCYDSLYLIGFRYDLAEDGISLPKRIKQIRKLLERNDRLLFAFNSLLINAGYLDSHSYFYTKNFISSDSFGMFVGVDFPKLTHSNVPLGIYSATYKVDLDNVNVGKISLLSVINLIQGL